MPAKSATVPMTTAANGSRPKKLRPLMAETRPRISSGERSCTMVLARPTRVETPSASSSKVTAGHQKPPARERLTSPAQISAREPAMAGPRRATGRTMMSSDPRRDPTPEANMSQPMSSAETSRTCFP